MYASQRQKINGFFAVLRMRGVFGFVRRSFQALEHLLRRFGCQTLVKDRQVHFLFLGKVDFDESVHAVQHAPQGLNLHNRQYVACQTIPQRRQFL